MAVTPFTRSAHEAARAGDASTRTNAGADANFVLTGDGNIAEAQATAEGETYDEEALLRLLRLARIGCTAIFAAQDQATGR